MRPLRAQLVVVACLLMSLAADAQVRYRDGETGRWRPWTFAASAGARQETSATPADVKAFEARLVALGEIVRRTPVLNPPIGFAADAHGYLAGAAPPAPDRPAPRTLPLAGGLGFGAFALFEYDRDGKVVQEESIATELLYFEINRIGRDAYTASKPVEWEAFESEAFIEPPSGPGVAGLTQVGDVFILRNNPKPLWLPFPIGAALEPVIAVRKTAFEDRRDAYQKAVAEFAAWQAPAARAARRADWQKAAAMLPNGAEFLQNMEDTEVQIEAINRERLAADGTDARDVAASEQEFRAAEAVLAALSPEQRSAPGCYDAEATALTQRFRLAADAPPSCRAVVRPNWAYFDASLPRSVPQIVMLGMFTRCLTPEGMKAANPAGCVINRQLVDTLDWDAVRAWLDH